VDVLKAALQGNPEGWDMTVNRNGQVLRLSVQS
jgi:hypothetical protein